MLEYVDLLKAALVVTSAVLYFISPIDLIPDMVPYIGYLDDAVVMLAAVLAAAKLYKKFQARRAEKAAHGLSA